MVYKVIAISLQISALHIIKFHCDNGVQIDSSSLPVAFVR